MSLPLNAVVVEKLKAGLLVGMSFMKENEIVIDIPRSLITIGGNQTVQFDNYIGNPKVSLIRVDANHIIFPGEAIAMKAPIIFNPDTELALEPRIESSFWFEPRIV